MKIQIIQSVSSAVSQRVQYEINEEKLEEWSFSDYNPSRKQKTYTYTFEFENKL